MRHKRLSRKQRVEKNSRRAFLWGLLVFLVTFTCGVLIWLETGRPRRHGNHWHWDKDKARPWESREERPK